MKKEFILLLLFATILGFWAYNCQGKSIQNYLPKFSGKVEKTCLNWVEVSNGKFATQVMFDFSKPFYFEKSMDKNQMKLELSFPSMDLSDFKKSGVIAKLKEIDLVKNVYLEKRSKPIDRVVLTIFFKSFSGVKNQANKNRFIIKWSKIEDPNRLILDIFTKDKLDYLKRDKSLILHAKNDYPGISSGEKKKPVDLNYKQNFKKKMRIVVDAGHGGKDPGVTGYNSFKEKDITLDIARRTKQFLKKFGFNVYLTRNKDRDLTLLERSEFANQLKADLFISIHVNSAGIVQNANGLETYYLDDKNVFGPAVRHGFFVFSNYKKDKELTKMINKSFYEKNHASKSLAFYIHDGIVHFLNEKGLSVTDRGIKQSLYRIFLRNEIPTTLVEVGFLTNPKEAKRLIDYRYRNLLAYGISKGIKEYILNIAPALPEEKFWKNFVSKGKINKIKFL